MFAACNLTHAWFMVYWFVLIGQGDDSFCYWPFATPLDTFGKRVHCKTK